jgi:hypothetical protein
MRRKSPLSRPGASTEGSACSLEEYGNVFVGGYTRGALVSGQANAGGEDMFIMKVDF